MDKSVHVAKLYTEKIHLWKFNQKLSEAGT